MESNEIGWATFYNEASTEFSTEFQTEMAKQLMDKFNKMVGIDNFSRDKKFMLFVGMTELKTTYEDGHAFSLVEIITPNSMSTTLTVYWKSEDNSNIVKADTLAPDAVEFGWCTDFDEEFFRSFARENVIEKIQGTPLKFKYVADVQLFPDLTITYVFKSHPTKDQLKEISDLLVSNFTGSYVSGIMEYEGTHVTMLDFQGTEYKKGVKQLEQFILSLNASEISEIIQSITIQ